MFKPLIKKVREESTNVSILPENNSSDETNGHLIDDETLQTRLHRRSHSNASVNKPRLSLNTNEVDKKEESIKNLAEIFSPYIDESISIDNFVQILKSWIDSKETILQEKDDAIERLTENSKTLTDQIGEIRSKLSDLQNSREKTSTENTNKIPYLQRQIDTLRSENENLKSDMKSLRKQLNDVEIERDDLLIKSTDVKSTDDFQRQLAKQTEEQKLEIAKLRQALLERDAIIEQQDKRLLVDHETQAIQTEDKSFVQILAEPDVDTLEKLQAELDEKNRTIKNLQQRYNDLRKTLQREFHASIPKDLNQMGSSKSTSSSSSATNHLPLIHYDSSTTSQSDVDAAKRASTARQMTAVRKNVTFTTETPSASAMMTETTPAILPHTSVETKPSKNGHRSSVEGQTAINGTNFKYLKHVLLKFMTSTEDEAIHLIRAVSTLLNLSVDEERLLRETLDYKMSWFGKVSRHKPV